MDRWFSSPIIYDDLWGCQTKAVGTVMPNRKGMPKSEFAKKLKKGEKLSLQREHLLAIKWRDVRDVYMLSTAHDDDMIEVPAARGSHEKFKPSAVVDYNKFKIGVDKSDQLLAYYAFTRKSIKWWKKLFFHLFDLAIVNAYLLYRKTCSQKLPLSKFCERLADDMVSSVGAEITEESRASTAGRLVGRDHFPHRIPAVGAKREGHAQRTYKSKHNTGRAVKKMTTVYCRTCDVGLCIGECFECYHTRARYWE